jgi:alpha-L-fucosidase
MKRRKFFHIMGGAAAGSAFWPLSGSKSLAANTPATPQAQTAGSDFNHYTEDYSRFCATPANERVFYALRDGRIVSEKLDNQGWKSSPLHSPRNVQLPVPGGSHNRVPMVSPIPTLAGQGPYKPTWDSLLQYECPEWYRDAKFGIWNHWSPQCVPEDGDWYARNMYMQGSRQNQFHVAHYGPPSRFGYKDLCAQWTLLNWEPAELMDLYQRAGGPAFLLLWQITTTVSTPGTPSTIPGTRSTSARTAM